MSEKAPPPQAPPPEVSPPKLSPPKVSRIEEEYRRRIDAMPMHKRVERAAAMAKWAREVIARQILAERGPLSEKRLKLEVARRVYVSDPRVLQTIDRELAHVPD